MARGLITPEQQILSVRSALATLRSLKPFRGQEDLVADAEGHLALLLEAHRRGRLKPFVLSHRWNRRSMRSES